MFDQFRSISKHPLTNGFLYIFLFGVALLIRFTHVSYLDMSDPTDYWFYGVQLDHLGQVPLYHRSLRFPILFVVYLFHQLSHNIALIQLIPLGMFALISVFTFWYVRKHTNTLYAIAAYVLLIFFINSDYYAAHIRPAIFVSSFVLLVGCLLEKYQNRFETKHVFAIVLISALAFQTHLLYLFYVPAILLYLYLYRGTLTSKHLAYIFGFAVLFYVIDAGLIYSAFGKPLSGRLGVIAESYGRSGKLEKLAEVYSSNLLARYAPQNLHPYWTFLIALNFVLYFFTRSKNVFVLSCLSFYFFITIAIKKIFPITPALIFTERYLNSSIPILLISVVMQVWELQQVKPKIKYAMLALLLVSTAWVYNHRQIEGPGDDRYMPLVLMEINKKFSSIEKKCDYVFSLGSRYEDGSIRVDHKRITNFVNHVVFDEELEPRYIFTTIGEGKSANDYLIHRDHQNQDIQRNKYHCRITKDPRIKMKKRQHEVSQ